MARFRLNLAVSEIICSQFSFKRFNAKMNYLGILFSFYLCQVGSVFIMLGMISYSRGSFAAESDCIKESETSLFIPSYKFKENPNVQSFAIFEEAAQNRE